MDWDALAQAVVARRVELGYGTRTAFIEASQIGARTVGDLETARRTSYTRSTMARLEQALQWPMGRAAAILRGDAVPIPAHVPLPPPDPRPVRGDGDAWQAMARLADVMASLDPQQRAALLARLDRLIVEAGGDTNGR